MPRKRTHAPTEPRKLNDQAQSNYRLGAEAHEDLAAVRGKLAALGLRATETDAIRYALRIAAQTPTR